MEGLQKLLTIILFDQAAGIDMSCNIYKTVAMVFSPMKRQMIINDDDDDDDDDDIF